MCVCDIWLCNQRQTATVYVVDRCYLLLMSCFRHIHRFLVVYSYVFNVWLFQHFYVLGRHEIVYVVMKGLVISRWVFRMQFAV